MVRTQLYVTDEQQQRIAQRAADEGVSKAEVIRRLLDEGLGVDDGIEHRRDAIRATAGIASDEPDWAEWLTAVRGAAASTRLDRLGS